MEDELARTVHRPRSAAPPPSAASPERAGRRRAAVMAGGAVAIGVVVVALATALVGGGSDPQASGTGTPTVESTTPSSAPATTATPTTVAVTTTVTAAPRPFPTVTTLLTSGFYATSTFQPRLTLTLGDGWKIHAETADDLEFGREDSNSDFLSFVKPKRVLPDNGVFATKAAATRASSSEPVPADLVAWLRSHDRLRVTATTPVTRAGVQGVQVDVVVTDGYGSDVCGPSCVPMFPLADGPVYSLLTGHSNRLYVLNVGGEQVLAAIEARADRFGAFVHVADRVVETVAFKG
jgi:hypothetical protein